MSWAFQRQNPELRAEAKLECFGLPFASLEMRRHMTLLDSRGAVLDYETQAP